MAWYGLLIFFPLCAQIPVFAGEQASLAEFVSRDKPFALLAQSSEESCSECKEQLLNQAFDLLDADVIPETILSTSADCLLEKNAATSKNELSASCYPSGSLSGQHPLLTFRFHTGNEKFVGISPDDLTGENIASIYQSHSTGVFKGKIRIVEFRYGDGNGFRYFRKSHHLQIHCKLIDLRTVPLVMHVP